MIKIYNNKGEWVGDFDSKSKVYITQRHNKLNQVFHYFGNALAIDSFVVEKLTRLKCGGVAIQVVGIEEKPFFAVSTLDNFITWSESFSYGNHGLQRRMALRRWRRASTLKEAVEMLVDNQKKILGYM